MLMGQSSPVRWTAPDGPWTEPDLHLFPQDGHRYEIVDGSLHVGPPPGPEHESVVRALVTLLRGAAPGGWWVCSRLGVEIGGSNVVPDVTVLRPYSSGAVWTDPDDVALVVEVETPTSRRFDRLLKPALYADAGIPSYWRVDPDGPTLYVHRLDQAGGYVLDRTVHGDELVAVDTPYRLRLTPSAWI
jgi:Uma2 family endonuclease